MAKRYTERDRSRFLTELRRSGDPVHVVAERLGLSVSTAFRWKSEAADASGAAPVFARLVREPRSESSLTLDVGGVRVQVRPGFDADLLREVVQALGGDER
jgi:transposase-like protein